MLRFLKLLTKSKIKFLILLSIILINNCLSDTTNSNTNNANKNINKNDIYDVNSKDNDSDKLLSIKNEFDHFLKKYRKNSCVMAIFSNFKNQCEEIDDKLNSILSYKMTLCVYSSLGKKLNFECNINDNKECIKFLEGDLWTTYITFSHHIDNLCFYYKTLLWEKSSEFLFFKLMNSSMNVLKELSQSYNLAEKMMNTQEKFTLQIEENLVETLKNFQNVNQFFENYTKVEEQLKKDLHLLENKINLNNEKMSDVVRYIDEKLLMLKMLYEFFNTNNSSNSLLYFLSLFIFIWCISFLEVLKRIRLVLNLLGVCFFLFEKFVLSRVCEGTNYFDSYFLYYNLIFYVCRVFYFLIFFVIILFRCYFHVGEDKKDSSKQVKELLSDYKTMINMTPMWMRKYFTKIKMQNEYLIDRFQRIKELMEKESLYLKNKNLLEEDENSLSYFQ